MNTDKPRTGRGKANDQPLETLEGTVERILFGNAESSYSVAAISPSPGSKIEHVIVGNLGSLQPQEFLKLQGRWVQDKKYGRQFRVESYESTLPSSAKAMEKYLGSGLIRGIGKTYAKRLVDHFGEEIFDVIENAPERLVDVEKIGEKRARQIVEGWREHRAQREIMLFLQQFNIPISFAARIYKVYGDDAIAQIRKNPYQLALDVRGIGFKSADSMAQKMGVPVESLERAMAAIYFLLQELVADGHTFFPADPLMAKAVETLGVDQSVVIQALNRLKTDAHIEMEILPDETRAVFLSTMYRYETGVAEQLNRLLCTGKLFPKIDIETSIRDFEEGHRFSLAENQRLAVRDALKGGVVVITGGPGTGKTTIIRTILRILEKHGISVLLGAPTGRAAKRMQELTNVPAATLHRLLQFSPQEGKYLRNASNPLRADFVIVDEASMVDIPLAHAFLRAVAGTASIIFVGDVDQLPSVGPGNFLKDLIRSRTMPVVRLNQVFRQAQASLIVTNAHRINEGRLPVLKPEDDPFVAVDKPKQDFYFIEVETPEECLSGVLDLVHRRIPSKFGFDPFSDIQVLAPMHRGVVGARNLNQQIQNVLNPASSQLERAGNVYRTGDKVMQMANDYDRDVYNGDIGVIASIDHTEQLVKVNFDGRIVGYDFSDMDALELAYCITVHKSQGSEYKAVVIPVHTTHYIMLQRNLLYTALTRGKKLVCLVGQRRALRMAVQNGEAVERQSALYLFLQELRKKYPSPVDL